MGLGVGLTQFPRAQLVNVLTIGLRQAAENAALFAYI